MSFSQLLSILMARKIIAIWVFCVTVLVTTVVSVLLPKSYTATASLVINSKGADPVTGLTLPATLMPGYMATQVDIIQSHNVALKVVAKLGVANSDAAKATFEKATNGEGNINDWFADRFLQNLSVKPSRSSDVIEIGYEGADPNFAADLANAFAEAYINTNLQMKTEPAKQAAAWFDQQIKGLRQNVEQAQAKLSAFQQENGIAFSGERMDTEAARLSELSSQLVMAQAQTYDSTSRQSQLKRGSASESPEILANGLIQGLKSQLVQAETRLNEVSQRLGVNHPQYQAAQSDVTSLRDLIRVETSKTSNSVGQTARVSQQKEAEINASLAQQKERVLKLKSQHDEMAVLEREVEGAQRMYDNALLRFGQTNLESQSGQTDVSVLNPAIAPLKHSSPKILLNIALSVFLGGLLGVGFVLVAEMFDRRVRSAEDLRQLLNMPVLGELSSHAKKSRNFKDKVNQFFKQKNTKKTVISF
ncbi:MAG: chain length determinant protein EpsF [Proteobacteria bacterium ST_bin12]|nr:MAG: chain length determinant protein EpsF [Proteobacteria bacterium ST_bin12]